MKKKIFTLLTLFVLCVTGAWASTVDDLKTLSESHNVYFADIVTAKVNAGTLFDSDYLLALAGGCNYANNKGTDGTISKLYCLRVKSTTQDVIAFKVGSACTIKIYADRMKDRTPVINTSISTSEAITGAVTATSGNNGYGVYNIPAAGTYYIIGNGSDCYLAGLEFTFAPAAKYDVTYKANGSGEDDVVKNVSKVDDNMFTYASHAFTGWNTQADGKGTAYAVGDAVTSVLTLYAQWTAVSAPTKPTISGAPVAAIAKNTAVTLTASSTGAPAPAYQWYKNTTSAAVVDEEHKLDGKTDAAYSPVTSAVGTLYYYVVATNSEGSATSDVVSVEVLPSTECKLLQAVYSNGFDAFIDEENKKVTVYYFEGQSAPTVTTSEISDDASINISNPSEIVVTAEDGTTTATYEVTRTAVEPYTEDGIKFNGTESWIKTGYTFHAERGWRFQKNSDDGRIPKGLTRLYFFVGHASSVKLINGGITTARDVYVYVNGVQQGSKTSVPKNNADPNYITIPCNSEADNMIAIVSAQTGGDGGFTAIEVTGSEETAAGETITPAKEYTTYVPTHDLDFTTATELTAYIATAANASTVTMTPVNKVPAGTPIVIKATATGSPIAVSKADETDDVSDNKLKIGDGSTSIGGDGKWDYMLSNGMFYHASAGVLPAGKCYLHLDAEPAANELTMDFGDGDVTGIKNLTPALSKGEGAVYDLQGRQVAQPTKGLYIMNGRKVIIK